ncbi:1-acyl-sn-glycerol-3-phosphate acyltransferase [Jiella endophytica]|uniref:1-acyl-sn-glycerol-3-phosphate acyltransferase n=1 Tax=Jiella endophytica TaxID=2558362 RepID=A0A4Y8RCE3_9HYPH|nr:1-acyl-sn-glycerol-3-phosphate acyltransferase [Jiella endophytica]TFF19675.1 1-acyl-sn-glycerol-3-phosphate acyltransferase [Jiella endophytica]
MTLLRSIAFNILFYGNLTLQLLFWSPVFFFASEATCWWIVRNWARSSLWLLEKVAGARSLVSGAENLPEGGAIVASKHQSEWEIMALLVAVDRPTFILKKELMHIPLFGSFARRMRMIPVDRSRRGAAIAEMTQAARDAVAEGRRIIIFPEGTRTAPGAEVDYRQGVFRLYDALGLPAVPVALNSGLFWPRRGFRKHPGEIRAEFLPPIAPGLDRPHFIESLRSAIESRSRELLKEAGWQGGDGSAPVASTATPAGSGESAQSRETTS